ncbi:hypothetical protein BGX21_002299 [Mortierella sp. AD011]|nr:hypothetical protein BGX20_009107 [Mortierella sp. AD010]KAF9403572.1 hypothetical protein BGX21_002299 [Mortierella sp. AD011]
MALQEPEEFEDDYVILSDIESDTELNFNKPRVSFATTTLNSTDNKSLKSKHSTASISTASSSHLQTPPHDSLSGDEEGDSDLDDIEEIEYGYDNDTLLIMPAMLRDYSHHATNYHPELWQAPIPGSFPPETLQARCRQEDRILDRQELLKNSIPPTTCGICFDSFVAFDLDPPRQHQESKPKEISTKAQFTLSFTARLARSFAIRTDSDDNSTIPTSSASTSAPSTGPSSSTNSQPQRRRSVASVAEPSATAPSITPSLSSKDIGIVMPCNHGLCLSCLQSLLTNATQNPQSRFPTLCPQPGCRTPIPTESAELVLDPEILEIWYRKLAEVHVANKVCCPKPECQSIIDLDDKDGTAVTCPECRSSFCATCAVPFHRGMTCEQYQIQSQGGSSEEDRAMLRLVQDRHWRHCPSCRFVIEKQQGCNHMVCHCGQSFCYACGYPWNELEARCSQECEGYGVNDDDGLDCIIM